MKTLRTLLLLLAAPFLLASCNNDDDDQAINVNQLPESAQTFLNSNFPGITVNSAWKDNDNYKVTSKDYEIEFDRNGNWEDIKAYGAPLPESVMALIPQAIRTYVAENYPANRIIEIDRESWGYEVDLNDYQGTELYFDLNGTFTRKKINRSDDEVYVEPAALPAAIKTFLATHFPDMPVQQAEKENNEYEVYLVGYSLEFKADGSWKSIESYRTALPQSVVNLLPEKIRTYLNANYQGIGVQEIDFENNKYEVQLVNNARTELEFDAQGNFLRIDN